MVPPLTFELIAGGRSNLTFRVEDAAGHTYALRRPPVSHVLPTAHDMGREYRVMTALGPTEVPVPRTYGLCQDDAVNGAPFYVMEFVEGTSLRDRHTAEAAFEEPARRPIGDHLADTLGRPARRGRRRRRPGRPRPARGLHRAPARRWTAQYEEMAVAGVDHGRLIEEVGAALAADVPQQRGVAVVHGDYRLDNVVLDGDGRVAAVLDWEICTLGDPLADVGLLLDYWIGPRRRRPPARRGGPHLGTGLRHPGRAPGPLRA